MRRPGMTLPCLTRGIPATLALIALLTLLAVACGGGQETGDGGTPTATATEVATPSPGTATATPTSPDPATTTSTATAVVEETPEPATATAAPPTPTTTPTSPTATAEATPAATAAPAATEAPPSETDAAGDGDAGGGETDDATDAGDGDADAGDMADGMDEGMDTAIEVDVGGDDEMAADMELSVGGDGLEEDMADSDGAADEAARERGSGAEAYVEPTLSAGEVNDNERWDEYLQYRALYEGRAVHDVDVSERYVVTVTDSDGYPVPNAEVRVSAGEAVLFEGRTYANGQTLFFPRAFPASDGVESFTLGVAKGEASEELAFTRGEEAAWDVVLDLEQAEVERVPLDVLFLLDSTGSMSDQIAQIKATLLSIATRISDLPSQPDLRLGMVAYRDRGDEFVTRLYDFEAEPARFLETIRGVVADGGGDYRESLNEALHVAVNDPEWRGGDAIRLVFLIADAPPHLDYQDDYSYAEDMVEAHRRGIKIFSIASSGLDAQGEYIFRQIAQHTMGRFLFIVYGPDGSTSHSVTDYTVERLDDLVVSLVEEELAFLSR